MSVLVTGGAGYVGSHTAIELLDKGYEVIIIDNLQKGHQKAVLNKAKFYSGDLRDEDFLHKVFEENEIEAVVHFAANSLVGESVEQPLSYYDNNVYGALKLLQTMKTFSVDTIVFSSTAAVYGEPKHIPILESDPTEPTNPYGETKLAIEKMMKWSAQAHGLKYTALRYFNVAGAHTNGLLGEDHSPETHLIPIILQVALGNRDSISIFGDDYDTPDGTCVRDYIHVTDLADAHILALENLKAGGESGAFNLGSGQGFSVKEVIETAREVTGKEIPAEVAPRRAGDPAKLVASSDKAKKILGWNPKRESLNEMVGSAWNWFRNHPGGYED
ncbi:UDP-glucose 4-epimerase GalE [Virgibacillus sp. MSP4-1]|uniref:UDP-glucose 4-epimerase GalE n=1 Tax=Virgibacillus sp. MSP4-1 TaxID=2700081 RepID=UPI0003A28D31|nr:UDP-glucose 4-epimerase GalE [Virgibacillus sp. MSP4-1]QHS23322.1 UDP-glucose 4-epimerase GalE [Virgibacillus sp. MSP4-1]